MNTVHVMPRGDLVNHEQSEDCLCGPHVEFVPGGKVVVHHSLDSREADEQGLTS